MTKAGRAFTGLFNVGDMISHLWHLFFTCDHLKRLSASCRNVNLITQQMTKRWPCFLYLISVFKVYSAYMTDYAAENLAEILSWFGRHVSTSVSLQLFLALLVSQPVCCCMCKLDLWLRWQRTCVCVRAANNESCDIHQYVLNVLSETTPMTKHRIKFAYFNQRGGCRGRKEQLLQLLRATKGMRHFKIQLCQNTGVYSSEHFLWQDYITDTVCMTLHLSEAFSC